MCPIFGMMVTSGRSRVAKISQQIFCKIIVVAHIPRVAYISENLRYTCTTIHTKGESDSMHTTLYQILFKFMLISSSLTH